MALRRHLRLAAAPAVNALFLVMILAASIGGVAVLDVVRAFVGGEAVYSKAQKGAVIALHRYAQSGNPADFTEFERLIAVPVSDRRAREILEDPSRGKAEAHPFRVGGNNHPEDVARLAWLFRYFGGTPFFAAPARAWRQADRVIGELEQAARALDESIGSDGSGRELADHLARIDALDAELTRLEAAFSKGIGSAAREITRLLYIGIGGLGLALALLGGGFAIWSIRRVDAAARDASAKQELLETAFENLGHGISVVDGDLNAVMFNRRFLELLDFPSDRFFPGVPFEKFIRYNCERGEYGPGDVEEMLRERVAIARRFEPHHVERARPDGTVLEIRGEPLPSGGFVTTYRDVTAERRMQAALEASEQRTRAVIDRALDAVVAIDAEDRIIEFNAAAEAMFGWPRGEALGKPLADLVIPERLRAQHRAAMARYLRTGEKRVLERRLELTGLRADGGEFPVEISVAATLAGDTPIFTAFIRDITARKETEAAHRVAEERLWAFLDGSPEPISLKDTQGRYLLCNSVFETMTGMPRERLAGLNDDRVFPGEPEINEIVRCHEAEVIGSLRPVRQFREWRSRDGRMRSFLVMKFPVFGAKGEIVGVGTFNQEITELRNAEAQLRQAQKMQALGLLTGGVAHDFNNLLAVVLGNLELLAERLEHEPGAHGLAVAAIGAGRRGAGLTQRLLAFARQQPLAPQAIGLATLLDGMDDLLRQSIGTGIRLEVTCAPGIWPAYADPGQLETALLNLAINARDAMLEGGTLTIQAANAVPEEMEDSRGEVEMPARAVVVRVSDTGPGMPPETRDRAFEPFFTTKPVGKGSGLGLSMVYGFARQSGGNARIVSAPGGGAQVELLLPAARAGSPAGGTGSRPGAAMSVSPGDDGT